MFPLVKTLRSFKEAKLIRYIVYDVLIALVIGGLFIFSAFEFSNSLVNIESEWLRSIFKYFVGGMATAITWFLLPVLLPLIAGLFEETIIKKVQQRYYPNLEEKEIKFWPDFLHDLKFTFVSLGLNILIIPWYFFGIGFLASILLNSYLLGREFFESAAGYFIGKPAAKKLKKKHRLKVYLGGLAITMITLTPVVNLVTPVIAIVWMVHIYHSIQHKEEEKNFKKHNQNQIDKIETESITSDDDMDNI